MQKLKGAKSRLEAGFVAMDPASGEIRAWVGSRDFDADQYDHVAQAERQPGSTFKPFVYGAALEEGRRPDTVYYDKPVEFKLDDGTVWRPTDMEGSTGEPMTLRQGLAMSKNTITAQVMRDVGVPTVVNLARAAGVNQSKLSAVPSLALGTSSVTLLEMASAYSTIARLGEYRPPVFVKRITDRSGKVLAEFGSPPQRRAMSADSAATLVDMMRDVVGMGTGWEIRGRFGITADVAGKTGTTQNNTDGWFMLMHPDLVAGAWVGFNDARVTMRSSYWGQGGHNAVLLVGDFFRAALKDRLIDSKAQFPRLSRPAIIATSAPVADAPTVDSPADDGTDQAAVDNPKGGVVVIEKADGSTRTAALDSAVRGNPLGTWQRVDALPHADPDEPHD
jgi:penicillin-binding protein 1A